MKFLFKTRCGCMREVEGFVPAPQQICIPLKQLISILPQANPEQYSYPEVRKFSVSGSYLSGEEYGYVYEEVK